jgi:hypothetical protein
MSWYSVFAGEQDLVNLANDILKANVGPEVQQGTPELKEPGVA